jgi:hypothetical protein
MMAPQAYEQLVHWRQQQLMLEASIERRAAAAGSRVWSPRRWLAASLYSLAARLSAGVAEARGGSAGIRSVATCAGVEYWRPSAMPLRR